MLCIIIKTYNFRDVKPCYYLNCILFVLSIIWLSLGPCSVFQCCAMNFASNLVPRNKQNVHCMVPLKHKQMCANARRIYKTNREKVLFDFKCCKQMLWNDFHATFTDSTCFVSQEITHEMICKCSVNLIKETWKKKKHINESLMNVDCEIMIYHKIFTLN